MGYNHMKEKRSIEVSSISSSFQKKTFPKRFPKIAPTIRSSREHHAQLDSGEDHVEGNWGCRLRIIEQKFSVEERVRGRDRVPETNILEMNKAIVFGHLANSEEHPPRRRRQRNFLQDAKNMYFYRRPSIRFSNPATHRKNFTSK